MGFKDWKHSTGQKGVLNGHSNGKSHTQAMGLWKARMAADESIGRQLHRMGSKMVSGNRAYVLTIMEGILYY